MLDERSVIARSDRLRITESTTETTLLDQRSGEYYALSGTAAFIWRQTEQPVVLARICDLVTVRYGIERDDCVKSVTGFLQQLATAGLVEIRDAS